MSWADEIVKMMKNKKVNSITQVIAKVETPPPNLTLKFSEQLIPAEQIYCSNYLLPHYHRNYKLDGIIDNVEIDVSGYGFDNQQLQTLYLSIHHILFQNFQEVVSIKVQELINHIKIFGLRIL